MSKSVLIEIKHRTTHAVLYTADIDESVPSGLRMRAALEHLSSGCERAGECILWTLSTVSGYGRFQLNGVRHWAHRLAWTAVNGPIPAGMLVLHRCDDRRCVNPDHLFLGTHAQNMADMVAKGRSTRGRPLTLEHRLKVAQAGRGRIQSAETRAAIAAALRAHWNAKRATEAQAA